MILLHRRCPVTRTPFLSLLLVGCQTGPSAPDTSGIVGGYVETMEVACDPDGGIVTKMLPDPGVVVSVIGCLNYETKRVCEPQNISSWYVEDTGKIGLRCAESDHDATAMIVWAPTGG